MNTTTALRNFNNVQQIFNVAALLQLTDHLWPKPACVPDGAEYDFIIIGGGTAGCVIATRLAALKKVRILLVEAGGNPSLAVGLPGYFAYVKQTAVDWNVTSIKEDTMQYHRNGVASIAQGKMLGGSSGINYMVYARGNPQDYDNWANLTNDESWSFREILPLFIKTEKVIDKRILRSPPDRALHGTKGKLGLRKYYFKIANNYLGAYEEIGTRNLVDVNYRNPLGVTNVLFTADKTWRQSTSFSFLRLESKNPYLDVLPNALVSKILFDEDKNAIGVVIRTNDNKTITVKANKEVILTAGAVKSPQLLMLSGIGPRDHLRSKNIEVIADLPVGNNFQDHPLCISVFKMGKSKPRSGPINPDIIGIPALDAYIAVNKSQSYPDFEILNLIIDDPEVFLVICAVSFSFTDEICDKFVKNIENRQLYITFNSLAYPKSRGVIRLNNTNIEDQPIIKLGYYTNGEDLKEHANNLIYFNRILNTTYFKNVDAEFIDPELDTCLGLEKQSEEFWRCYCKGMVTTGHYYGGTCPMGTVVDSKLLVKGVKRLRLGDASIMPTIVASPTVAAVIMIAQKTSNMIIDEYSLN